MRTFKIPKTIKTFSSVFHEHGHHLYIVGGAVRDHLLGRESSDFDFATDALPGEVMAMFRHVIPTGIEHGTVTVLYAGEQFEVTTFRTETGYSDSRHPDEVHFVRDLSEDLSRRDFTMNAIAVDTQGGSYIDEHEGMRDIEDRYIRAIGDPHTRFSEDSLRILRGYRFISSLGFSLEQQTRASAAELRETIRSVSIERIREEFNKILSSRKPSDSLEIMQEDGLLQILMPELSACLGVEQKGFHLHDVFYHSIYACDSVPSDDLRIRWAALLHDIGKPATRRFADDGIPTFYNHESKSADMADVILRRMKFSNAERTAIVHLIRQHMYHYTPEWSDAAIRRFLKRVGVDTVEDLFSLRRADACGTNGAGPDLISEREFSRRIHAVLEQQAALSVKDLKIGGRDLMAAGIPAGPVLGTLLEELLDTVLDDPSLNEKERLLEIAAHMWERIR